MAKRHEQWKTRYGRVYKDAAERERRDNQIEDKGKKRKLGITKIKTGKSISLSEQELVDYDTSGEDQSCKGGYMEDGFKFIEKHGLASEATYPYKAEGSTCNTEAKSHRAAKIIGYEIVPVNNEKALLIEGRCRCL
ncbi:hypothetical protein Syun_027834 [Stephania yunnanensis]|uniref:Peptidase C1A papain C-terminal domain-containing protein n=1 Tax=Stephania yunnanensis TaxID=152371 RepID=A0AAP0HLE1_9MAGN